MAGAAVARRYSDTSFPGPPLAASFFFPLAILLRKKVRVVRSEDVLECWVNTYASANGRPVGENWR